MIAIEDVHWADTELAVFLNGPHLDAVDGPLLVVATSRPAPDAVAAGPDGLLRTRIRLEPLRADEAASALVGAVAESALSPTARAAISERCGAIRSLSASSSASPRNIAAPDAEDRRAEADLLPETIQAVIAARFDLLGADARGRPGRRGPRQIVPARRPLALARLDPASPFPLDTALDELMRLDVLRADSAGGCAVPASSRSGTRSSNDVAYSQLTRADRATRHAAAARWLAGVGGPDRGDTRRADRRSTSAPWSWRRPAASRRHNSMPRP